VRPGEVGRFGKLSSALLQFDSEVRALPGIENPAVRSVLVEQMIESLRRIEYIHFIRDHKIDPERANPANAIFDPIRAAVFRMQKGEIDEAFWLVFLSVHCGKHGKDGWRLARDVYGAMGGKTWSWARVSHDVAGFRRWLAASEKNLKHDGVSRRFSNHRKYQSLSASSESGTGATIASYVNWIAPPRTHPQLLRDVQKKVGQNPGVAFDYMYHAMDAVVGFGRLAKFDFLTMLGKLGLAPIRPNSAYLNTATGPLSGARLLFDGDARSRATARQLDTQLIELDSHLNVGMQVLEDSLCNWQKSPGRFVSFRG
jgi:hypothetical protein